MKDNKSKSKKKLNLSISTNNKVKAEPETVKYYNAIAEGYNNLHSEEQILKFKLIQSLIEQNLGKKLPKNFKMLDVGCGTCISFEFFKCKVYGIEPSALMTRQFKQFDSASKEGRLFIAPAEEIRSYFKENFFDIVICVTSAHHFTKSFDVLKQVSKVANQNAFIVFSLLKKSESTKKLLKELKSNSRFKFIEQQEDEKDILILLKNAPKQIRT
jgi:ubiquinone/menaquinone biosynthesis C-methylase UbiE